MFALAALLAGLAWHPLPQQSAAAPRLEVRLATPPAGSKAIRWSPKGATVALVKRDGALHGSFALGHRGTRAVTVRLEKSGGSEHHDLLWIDADRDGELRDAERLQTRPNQQRGKWWSSFTTEIAIPMTAVGDQPASRPYPLGLWFVEDPQAPDAEPQLRWSRRGWTEGQIEIGNHLAFVLVTEMQMDGVIDQRDAWAIARDRDSLLAAPARSLDRHVWLDGVAYRTTAIDGDGRSLAFEAFDPGSTESEERDRDDLYKADREAERAPEPLPFGRDFAAALATAKTGKRRVFVDFQTTWCGPCRQMEQLVYTAKDVVEAAREVVPVVLDGDDQRALVQRYQVTAYPTMLLLDEDGKELRRAVGYRGVAAMVEFLRDG